MVGNNVNTHDRKSRSWHKKFWVQKKWEVYEFPQSEVVSFLNMHIKQTLDIIQGGPERMQHLRSLISKKPGTKSN